MKHVMGISILISVAFAASIVAEMKPIISRLTKKDKIDMQEMLGQLVEGPMARIERSIEQLNEVANQIQNVIVDVNLPCQCNSMCDALPAQLDQIIVLLQHIVARLDENNDALNDISDLTTSAGNKLQKVVAVLGNLNDESVGSNEFTTIDDIDQANLSLVSLLKTNVRIQIEDELVS